MNRRARSITAPKARNMKARGRCREARQVNHSAEGAKYESQGQARSASPLVKSHQTRLRPEGPNYRVPYYAVFRADALLILLPGATRFALAPSYHIPRLWRFYACPLAITFGAFGAYTLWRVDQFENHSFLVDVERQTLAVSTFLGRLHAPGRVAMMFREFGYRFYFSWQTHRRRSFSPLADLRRTTLDHLLHYRPLENIDSISCGGTTSSCSYVQSFGFLSVRQRRNCAV